MASKEDKKIEIINAAISVFSTHGFHKAKIEDIAKEAGIGKGTIYEYFDSKKSLFQEMIRHGVEEYKSHVKMISLEESSTREKLIGFAEYHGRFLSDHIDMAQSIINQSDTLSVEMRCWMIEEKLEIFRLIEKMISDGIESGELRKNLDKELVISNIIGTTNQYYTKKIFLDKMSYKEIDSRILVDTIFRGIGF